MITQEHEYYIRFILLLINGGTELLREIAAKALQKCNTPLGDFLSKNKSVIQNTRYLSKEQKDILYPSSPTVVPDVNDYDISLLSYLITNFLTGSLDSNEKNAVYSIKEMRNVCAHTNEPKMTATTYVKEWTKLVRIIITVSQNLPEEKRNRLSVIIDSIENEQLDIKAVTDKITESEKLDQTNDLVEYIKKSMDNMSPNMVAPFIEKVILELTLKMENQGKKTKVVNNTCFVNTNRNISVYGGRLIKFTADEMEQIVQDCTGEKDRIGQGSFGAVVFKSDCLQKRYGITVAIKKISAQESQKEQVLNVIKKEMFVSKVRHPFILPTMSVLHELSGNQSIFYCISPFCENGDLYRRLHYPSSQHSHLKLDSTQRIRIVLQISLGIHYLHTPVADVRGVILHKDISSSNIVLDRAHNARLIDFGLARELGDDSTTYSHRMFYVHPEVGTKGCNASPKWDYYSFGVVIRELLTGMKPDSPGGNLNKLSFTDIQECWNKQEMQDIWRNEETFTTLNTIAEKCMTSTDLSDFKIEIVNKLKDLFEQKCLTKPIRERDNDDPNRCIQCMTHPGLSSATEKFHSMNCFEKFSICLPCEKDLYVNPVSCYSCEQELQPLIGKNWGALLIAGNDELSEFASIFRNDVEKMKKVLTSQSPVIIGIRKELVKEIYPQTPGKPEELLPKLKEAVEELKKYDIHTLVFYFSGHGKGPDSGNSFQLGSKKDLLKTDDLQKMLESLTDVKVNKVILFMDRCYPPEICLKETKERVINDNETRSVAIQKVQINACETEKKALIDSRFTKYLIEGLKPSSNNIKSDNAKLKDDFITVTDLQQYTDTRYKEDKLQIEPVFYVAGGIKYKDLKIAYRNSEPVTVEFNIDRRIESLEVDLFQHIDDLKSEIMKMFGENKSSCTSEIFRETFKRKDETSNDGQEAQGLRCTTIEEVMMAWVLGQRLSVKIIKFPEV